MKYPFIIFYRHEKYSDIDQFFIDNKDTLNCTVFLTSNNEDLNKLFNFSYQILITYGPLESEYTESCFNIIASRMTDRWLHMKSIKSIDSFNNSVNYCFINNCTLDREHVRPVFSVFSSTYNSYDKILRPYNSLKLQTFKDWEWVIIDDSPDDEHFKYLRNLLLKDHRVRLYRRGENSGNIGNVKNECVSLCRGKYVLELDHDDEILPFVLEDSVNLFNSNKEVGFIYMDFINIYENGQNFKYDGNICCGYGSYYCQKYNNKWVYVYITPNINNNTLSLLICCPNHPRIWRKDTLINCGNYSELLPICDDHEILIRTALNTKMAKIHKFGYIQYMNNDNNNFSLIRNGEINRIGPQFISPIFYDKFQINDKMKKIDAYEEYNHNHVKIWEKKSDEYTHKFCNLIVNPDFDKQFCIIGIDSLISNLEKIQKLYSNTRHDFILLDNNYSIEYLCNKLDLLKLDRFKCHYLTNNSNKEMVQYFMLMYKSCDEYEIIY